MWEYLDVVALNWTPSQLKEEHFFQHHSNHWLASLTCLMGVAVTGGVGGGGSKNKAGKSCAKDCLFHVLVQNLIDLPCPRSSFPGLCGTLELRGVGRAPASPKWLQSIISCQSQSFLRRRLQIGKTSEFQVRIPPPRVMHCSSSEWLSSCSYRVFFSLVPPLKVQSRKKLI